jgi:hypothetical protein
MSFLDMYQGDQSADMAIKPNEAHDLPATFSDTFGAAWSEGRLFGQSIAHGNAQSSAFNDYLDEVKTKSGVDISKDVYSRSDMMVAANERVAKLKADNPALDIAPLDDDGLEKLTIAKSQLAQSDYAAMDAREKTFGGILGKYLGSAAALATDPINILALPVAPEASLGVLASALRWGAVGAGAQAGIEVAGMPYREEVQPGYSTSGEPAMNVAGGFAGGAVLGGATKALGNLWTRAKTGAWPTSIRDAGNVVESHANVIDSNVYLGAEGEAAHWDAMNFSIDNILKGEPVDVSHIITPQLEDQSRNLMARLEGQRATSLPIFDQRAVALISEEAGLRSRAADITTHIEGLPPGDATAADRLNRLQAVDAQIKTTSDPAALRALNERRDQILVDTTPEALQQGAAPIEQRRAAVAQQDSINARLDEIAQERARIDAGNLSQLPKAVVGQTEPVRAVPIETIRQNAAAAAAAAKTEREAVRGDAAPELPFQANAAEGHAQASSDALTSGVAQIAKRAGYDMPGEEAGQIADRLTKMTPDEAQDTFRDLQISPSQVADHPDHTWPEPARPVPPEPTAAKATETPDFAAAVRSDIDRERMIDDRKIPVDVDKNGNVVYRSLDDMADEVDAYHAAADQIQACAAPAPAKGAE